MNPLITADLAAMRIEGLLPRAHRRTSPPRRGSTIFRSAPRADADL